MSARSDTTTSSRSAGGSKARRPGKQPTRKLNRAQQQAMEIRAAATGFAQPVPKPAEPGEAPAPAQVYSPRVHAPQTRVAAPRPRKGAVPKPVAISREEEYSFIHADLRRLLITAGSLLILMLVLLFFVEH